MPTTKRPPTLEDLEAARKAFVDARQDYHYSPNAGINFGSNTEDDLSAQRLLRKYTQTENFYRAMLADYVNSQVKEGEGA